MSWTPLEPVAVSGGTSMVRVAVRPRTAAHGPTIKIIMAETFLQDFDVAERMAVHVGDAENAGMLRLCFAADGVRHFPFKRFGKGGGFVTIPHVEGAHAYPTAPIPVRTMDRDRDGFTLVLPMEKWAEMPVPTARAAAAPPKTKQPDLGRPTLDKPKVDAVVYLQKKTGKRISRLAAPWWLIGDERVHLDEILRTINNFRAKEGLGGIDQTQLAA